MPRMLQKHSEGSVSRTCGGNVGGSARTPSAAGTASEGKEPFIRIVLKAAACGPVKTALPDAIASSIAFFWSMYEPITILRFSSDTCVQALRNDSE